MVRQDMNVTAMRETLVLIGGEAWANSVASLYFALDAAETRGFEVGKADLQRLGNVEFSKGFDQATESFELMIREAYGEGYNDGYEDAGDADVKTAGIFDNGYEMGYDDGRADSTTGDNHETFVAPWSLEDLKQATGDGRYRSLPPMVEQKCLYVSPFGEVNVSPNRFPV